MDYFCKGFAVFGYTASALSCDQCGQECRQACGTRHFRSCCFNYVRKRSSPAINQISDEMSRKQPGHDSTGFGVSSLAEENMLSVKLNNV